MISVILAWGNWRRRLVKEICQKDWKTHKSSRSAISMVIKYSPRTGMRSDSCMPESVYTTVNSPFPFCMFFADNLTNCQQIPSKCLSSWIQKLYLSSLTSFRLGLLLEKFAHTLHDRQHHFVLCLTGDEWAVFWPSSCWELWCHRHQVTWSIVPALVSAKYSSLITSQKKYKVALPIM